MKKEIILFDLDGTLTDPVEGITKSVQYALGHYGICEEDLWKLTPFIGPPLRDSFMKYYGFSKAQADEAVWVYREYFAEKGIFENREIQDPQDAGNSCGCRTEALRGHIKAGDLCKADPCTFSDGFVFSLYRRRGYGRDAGEERRCDPVCA